MLEAAYKKAAAYTSMLGCDSSTSATTALLTSCKLLKLEAHTASGMIRARELLLWHF